MYLLVLLSYHFTTLHNSELVSHISQPCLASQTAKRNPAEFQAFSQAVNGIALQFVLAENSILILMNGKWLPLEVRGIIGKGWFIAHVCVCCRCVCLAS